MQTTADTITEWLGLFAFLRFSSFRAGLHNNFTAKNSVKHHTLTYRFINLSDDVGLFNHAAACCIMLNTYIFAVKPTVRVSPIVSSSTSPSSQTDRQTNGQTRTQPASTSSSAITSSNGTARRVVVQSSEAQSSGTPAHAVLPTSSVNSQSFLLAGFLLFKMKDLV